MSLGKLIFTGLGYASAVCTFAAQKMKFLVSLLLTLNILLRIWSHLLKKFLVENFIFQEGPLQKKLSLKFHSIHRKSPILQSLFNKVAGLQDSNQGVLP